MHHQGGCGSDRSSIGRRGILQLGSLFGLGLTDLLRWEKLVQASPAVRSSARAKSVIFIFQAGGPSQHETVDPKPEAPSEIRGAYGVTQTRIPGVNFCEHLPKLSARTDKFAVVRTMHHTADRQFRNEHSSCQYMLNTGTTALPIGDTNASISVPRPGRLAWPSIGSMIAYAAPTDPNVGWPAVIELPRANLMNYPGREPGLLGPQYGRWGVDLAPPCHAKDTAGSCPNCFSHDDPNDPARAPGPGPNAWWDNSSCRNPAFHLPDLGSAKGLTIPQLTHRADLLKQLEQLQRESDISLRHRGPIAWDADRQQALRLLAASRPGKHNPFDLSQESPATRGMYGNEEWGQGFLVARRLVEAGVRMVQINLRGWDTHQNAFRDLKARLLPSIDQALSGLLDDLHDRGLLSETLVVMCGEMGRTPRISPISAGGKNASGEVFTDGRHHWGDVFPCWFAGAGITPGQVIGTTDAHGGLPITEAYTAADLAATIFDRLGINLDQEFHDSTGRPYRITQGEPIKALWS